MMRSIRGAIAVLAGLALAVPGMANAAPSPSPAADPGKVLTASTQKVRVMVVMDQQPTRASDSQESAYVSQQNAKLADWSSRFDVDVRRQFGYLVNAFSAEMPENRIADLASQPGVRSVTRARIYQPTEAQPGDLTQVVQARDESGLSGTGMVVSIVDTGIDASHQDMQLSAAGQAGAKIQNVKPGDQFSLKVPYGHNFADENETVKDLTTSQHGMHVAGIVAANGGPDADPAVNGRVNGAAPDAQLLAMKVFSNDPAKSGSAYDDDIIAAIEDSVKHGADIINMSLGSPNGFSGSDFGMQKAIRTATDEGVLVVVSAGNSGLRTSLTGDTDDQFGTLDDGSVGGPSTADDALSIASVEGATIAQSKANAFVDGSTSPEFSFAYSHQAGDLFTTPTEIADGGLGKPEDLTGVSGKIALIKRGELDFATKISNALAAGASGILMWNHEAGGEEFINMAGLDGVTKFAAFIGNSAGAHLLADLKDGKDVRVAFTTDVIVSPNEAELTPSTFTSWGPTPSLEFKPELAGIGGNVYSTLNDNTYGTMSGTSMAAPNVAGISALLLEKVRADSPGISTQDAIAHVRTALINTAKILTDSDDVPFAPRQMGAGLAQTADAMATDVTATVEGSAHLALKQIQAPRRVTVTLANDGTTARTYTTASEVINESNEAGETVTTSRPDDESAISTQTNVTVPAGGSATVDFTITPNSSRDDHYIEGWLQLRSADATQPDLSVPFLGFVGDWTAEPVIDAPVTDPNSLMQALFGDGVTGTQLLTRFGDSTYRMGETPWISPNGDGDADVVIPAPSVLRSATRIDYRVLDAAGNVVAQPGVGNEVVPDQLSDILSGEASGMHIATEALFDGSLWDAAAGAETKIPDGHYTYQVRGTLGEGFSSPAVDLPFGVDTVAPTLELKSTERDGDDVTFTYAFTDDASGWGGASATIGYDEAPATVSDPSDDGIFTVTVPGAGADPAAAHHVVVTAADAAGNPVTDTRILAPGLVVEHRGALTAAPINDQSTGPDGSPLVTDGAVTVQVRATDGITAVAVQGADTASSPVDPDTHMATVRIPLTVDAANQVVLQGLDTDGDVIVTDDPFTITYDTKAPTLTLSSPVAGEDGLVHAHDGVVTVAGTVSDNLAGTPTVTVNGEPVTVTDGAFSVDLTDPTSRVLTVSATDGVNTTRQVLTLSADSVKGASLIDSISLNPSQTVVLTLNAHSAGVSSTETGPVLTVSGRLNRTPSAFTIGGTDVEVAADGTFSHQIPLVQGANDTNFTLVDEDGTVVLDTAVKIFYDEQAPDLTLESPKLHPGPSGEATLFANSSPVKLTGTIQDNTTGYRLMVNSQVVTEFSSIADLGDANAQSWSWTGPVKDQDTLRLQAVDDVDNGLDLRIPVIIDKVKPVLSIEGVTDGQVVLPGSSTPVTVTASDTYLDTLEVLLDGKPVPTTTDEDGTMHALVDAGTLASGTHELTALATDFAGNTVAQALGFVVNAAPVIEGPDSVTVDPDDDGWKDALLGNWSVTDDEEGATLTADLSQLVLGENTLVLTATDIRGTETTRTVTVVVERPLTTLDSGCVSMQARFVRGDTLDAKCSTSGNRTTVVVSNAGATLDGRLTVTAGDVVQVLHEVDGKWLPIAFEKFEGGVSFLGSSDATYVLFGPDSTTPGEGNGGGDNGSGSGAGVTGPVVKGKLSRTGSDAQGLFLIGGLLALTGAAAWGVSRRRKARA